MKIIYSRGCITDNITVDGENFNSLHSNKKREILIKALSEIDNIDVFQNTIIEIARNCGDYSVIGECSCCGDIKEEFIVEL